MINFFRLAPTPGFLVFPVKPPVYLDEQLIVMLVT